MHISIISACFNADEDETCSWAEFYSVLTISRAIGKELHRLKRNGSSFKNLRRRIRYERRNLLERTILKHFPNHYECLGLNDPYLEIIIEDNGRFAIYPQYQ